MRTDAQKKADARYRAAHKASTLVANTDQATADRYRAWCAEHGTTPNADLLQYIRSRVGDSEDA